MFHLDIIIQILLCLPAEFLYDCGRFVCQDWASIIRNPSFIEAHLLKSKGGLLFRRSMLPFNAHFLDLQNGNETELRYPFWGLPLVSCRGICLFLIQGLDHASYDKRREPSAPLYIVNPITRQFQLLPSPGNGFYKFLHIAYIEQSREFKAVCLFSNFSDSWLVFTLGIDISWRILHAMNNENYLTMCFRSISVAVGQFVYLSHGESIVVINLHDENTCSVQYPNGCTSRVYYLRQLGDNLCWIVYENGELQVWMLRDLETCEWVRVSYIEKVVARMESEVGTFFAMTWLNDSRIFIMETIWGSDHQSFITSFNAETDIKDFIIWANQIPEPSVIHTNSLVRW